MMHKLLRVAGAVMLIAVAGLIVAGCGGDDDETTTAATQAQTTTEAMSGGTLEIKMGDFYFDPENAKAKAGETTIKAPNEGSVEHELVIFKTDMNPASLPTDSSGGVDEQKLEDEGAEEIGEIEAEPGETASGKFNLTPGKYVMICNLPGHYAQGMYGSLTVTG